MAESNNPEGGAEVAAAQEPQILFPEEEEDDGNHDNGLHHSERFDEIRPSVIEAVPGSPPTSNTIGEAAGHGPPVASSGGDSPALVIPTEDKDLASKRKLAGITYFSHPGQQTAIIREQKEKLKSSGAGSETNTTSDKNPAGNNSPENDEENATEVVKLGSLHHSDHQAPTTTSEISSTNQTKSYLEAMTPVDQQVKDRELKEHQKKARPSYLNALDSESFKVVEEDSNDAAKDREIKEREKKARPSYLHALDSESFRVNENNNDSNTDNNNGTQQPIPVSQPGAHSFGVRSSVLANHNSMMRGSIIIGEDSNALASNFGSATDGTNPELDATAAGDLAKLAVALEVNEDDISIGVLSFATPDLGSTYRTKEDWDKETKSSFFMIAGGILFLLAVFFLGLGLALGFDMGKKPDPTPAPTTSAPTPITSPPIAADPISEEILLLESILPEFSKAAIRNDPESPQGRAYDWVLEDLLDGTTWDAKPDTPRILQRYALATFYFSTKGDEWFESDGWLDHSLHECLWFAKPFWGNEFTGVPPEGFFFDSNPNPCEWNSLEKNVTYEYHWMYEHFWLYDNGLQGTLPRDMSLLTGLVSIYLHNNSFSGPIPSELGLLQSVRVLNLGASKLTGTLPSELGSMYTMKDMYLFETDVAGTIPSELGKLTLAMLNLHNNMLTGSIPDVIANMSTVRHLWLSNNRLKGSIPSELAQVYKLSSLKLFGNQWTGSIPSQLFSLTRLWLLWLHDTSLTGTLPTQVGQMVTTFDFKLGNNQLSGTLPSQLGLCTSAMRFEMQSSQLYGTIPPTLGQWSSLTFFNLSDNLLTGTIPSDLPAATPRVPFWRVDHYNKQPKWVLEWEKEIFAVDSAPAFQPATYLLPLVFDVQDNQLSGTIPANFSLVQNMTAVHFRNNALLSGTVPPRLCDLREGLAFDCTDLICGCNCTCAAA